MNANAQMARFARDAAEMVRAEYGHELDFSEPTIGAVEALLNGFWQDAEKSDELFRKVALLFGSYIGEMIRTHYPQATWSGGSLTPDAPPPSLHVGEIELSPIVWCFKRLYNGPGDSVVNKYLAFRQAVTEGGQDAEPGAAAGRPRE
ncbi:MAG TPA: hypothetical protein VG013_41635 [Gemmataceae bacterium]|nr:hypothetical protein [Gemmataceae bacterium]